MKDSIGIDINFRFLNLILFFNESLCMKIKLGTRDKASEK